MNNLQEILGIINSEKLNDYLRGQDLAKFKSLLIHGFSNVLIFIFTPSGNYPEFIIKINRTGSRSLKDEFDILVQFEDKSFLKGVVPKAFGYNISSNVEYFVQSALKGDSLAHLTGIFSKKKLEDVLRLSTVELVKFHSPNREKIISFDENKTTQLHYDITKSLSNSKSVCNFSYYEGRLKNMFFRIKGASVPLVVRHDDFWLGNILRNKSGLGIVDWDRASLEGFPLCDLFDLLLNCSRLVYSSTFKRYAFDIEHLKEYALNAFFGKGITHLAVKYINSYCLSLDIDTELVKPLFLWHMMNKYQKPCFLDFFFKNESRFLKSF
jgi:thiamine kinase-like enzyme